MSGRADFLPVTRDDMRERGIAVPDFVLVTGDAYVDHPSFGAAIIGRVLEEAGFNVCILAQPDWRSTEDFKRFGRPKLGFMVTSGNLDSMVNHYTAAKKPRSTDAYSPGGARGRRPDRAVIAYTNRIREAYPRITVVLGGVEASLRRFAHYDYWDDAVRRSVLADSGADALIYGMADDSVVDVAKALKHRRSLEGIPGVCLMREEAPEDAVLLPSFDDVTTDKAAYAKAFALIDGEQDPVRGKTLAQPHPKGVLVQYKPAMPLSRERFDAVYALPFARRVHPDALAEGDVPAMEEVQWSLTATRGCFGSCAFCALTHHQGRIITSRSTDSLVQEAGRMATMPGFKGNIHDVGGPTANFRQPACDGQLKHGACRDRRCLSPEPCKRLRVDHREFIGSLDALTKVPGVKRVFVRSGVRYDYLMLDKDRAVMDKLLAKHVSGQLKVAPEHVSNRVLRLMGKPSCDGYINFEKAFYERSRAVGKEQYIVPYFMSSHPGCTLRDALELALYMRDSGCRPEQVQDFYPTPGTLSTCMYHTGLDPHTMKRVHIPRDPEDKAMQRALLQYGRPGNAPLVRKALTLLGRDDLIGYGRGCLVKPARGTGGSAPSKETNGARGAQRSNDTTNTASRASGARTGKGARPAQGGKPGKRNDPRKGRKGRG